MITSQLSQLSKTLSQNKTGKKKTNKNKTEEEAGGESSAVLHLPSMSCPEFNPQ
jgi:hypothetical protein